MWGLLERTKELAAKMENQLNEAAGLEIQGSKKHEGEQQEQDDALNDAWNDDFDDDALAGRLDIDETGDAAGECGDAPTKLSLLDNIPPPSTDNGGWEDEINFDGSEQDVVYEKLLPPPIESDLLASQLDQNSSHLEMTHQVPELLPASHEQESGGPMVEQPERDKRLPDQTNSGSMNDVSPDHVRDVTQTQSLPSEETSPVMVEQPTVTAWEEDLYDDDDDEEEEEEDEGEHVDYSLQANISDVAPPATISIPSQNANDKFVNEPPAVTADELNSMREHYEQEVTELKAQMQQVLNELHVREAQIAQKAEQMASIIASHEAEKDELRNKIKETKEEAKRRIIKAKERVEALERASVKNSASADDMLAKDATIIALREEGQKLAQKQAEMEKAVRSALAESRDLMTLVEEEKVKKEKAIEKAASLEIDLKKIKEDLNAARRGESQASKLENELQALKEEADRKDTSNLSFQQLIKELKAENKELRQGMEAIQKGAMVESKRESNKLKKEHSDLLAEMEMKLRVSERDASIREDALRTEVTELRKRWQDAVRRADALSMDVQNSTAPLLRQLESIERQNRVRATAWAELETKLRNDVENLIIENEALTKERNEYKSSSNRLSRISKERDDELSTCKNLIEDQKVKISKHELLLEKMETEGKRMKEEWSEVERLANEGVSKVRSDMMKTVLESEERHQAQLKSIENELSEERKIRRLLEQQVEDMLEKAGMMVVPTPTNGNPNGTSVQRSLQKKLRSADSQGSILADAISGLEGDNKDDADLDEDYDATGIDLADQVGKSSFAAMEQLSQRLKEAKVELEALRQSLASSERIRESLLEELASARVAKEKLPLFEAKVQELALENREKGMEIVALKEDIAEIRQLYRGQLNMLIEEKAATLSETSGWVTSDGENVTPMQSPALNVESIETKSYNGLSLAQTASPVL